MRLMELFGNQRRRDLPLRREPGKFTQPDHMEDDLIRDIKPERRKKIRPQEVLESTPTYTEFDDQQMLKFFIQNPNADGRMYSDAFEQDNFLFVVDGQIWFYDVKHKKITQWNHTQDMAELMSYLDDDPSEPTSSVMFYWINGNEDWMETTLLSDLRDAVSSKKLK